MLGADDSREISVRGSFLMSFVVVKGGMGAADEVGLVGWKALLAATTLEILTEPKERKLSALE